MLNIAADNPARALVSQKPSRSAKAFHSAKAFRSGKPLPVAVGVIRDRAGDVLVARRGDHLHQGRLWEFPGGKIEPGESAVVALARELVEELGISIDQNAVKPLIEIPHRYPDREVLLKVFEVPGYRGRPRGLEGQPLRWCSPGELRPQDFPAANRGIITALQLPDHLMITGQSADDGDFVTRLERALRAGVRLVQLRSRNTGKAWLAQARVALDCCRDYQAALILNGHPALLKLVAADGIHLSGELLRACRQRPVASNQWFSAACHNRQELLLAQAMGADFALLSPVQMTTSHPGGGTLGWQGFADLVAEAALPVYALGGMAMTDRDRARGLGGQGIAAISGLWSAESVSPVEGAAQAVLE